ncbi:hypothetical protein MCFN_01520 [Mycoplasmopsis californica]|uniref:Uncharacterized protein n=1 Tax=Mycoplasmopsis californica TaxID=2113 RepID=A0A059XLP0_9BACT|nr:hypothetical protein [Mycoplasmopsis californica]AIA29449.1 hypothetical protein MCFN_01520 [Mycoplasmopsis californica]
MYWSSQIVKKIVLTGLLLALSIIGDFFGKFLPFNSFLKFNLSLIFTLSAFRFIGISWGMIVVFSLMILGPTYSSAGYTDIGILGHALLLLAQTTFILFYLLFYKLITVHFRLKHHSTRVKAELIANPIALIIATILATVFMIVVNVFFATPTYFYLFKAIKSPNFVTLAAQYDSKFKGLFFGIPNYYLGSSVVYGLFNISNYAINSVLIVLILRIGAKANLFTLAQNAKIIY